MNTGAMNSIRPQMAKAINNLFPVVTPKSFGSRGNGVGLETQHTYQCPVVLVPYGNSYMYYQPIPYYTPVYPQPVTYVRQFSTQPEYYQGGYSQNPQPRRGSSLNSSGHSTTITDNRLFNSVKNFGYATKAPTLTAAEMVAEAERKERALDELQSLEEAQRNIKITSAMTADELHEVIMRQFILFPRVRLSWFNKLLLKVSTKEEWYKACEVLDKFHERLVEISSETGTLIIKAACRAGVPEHVLALLKDLDRVRIWPTLGGIHYLMINFSLQKNTKAVRETFNAALKRKLEPTVRTYQILIRECVDNDLVDDALKYAEESERIGLAPNRVTYNILMNGLRKANRAEEILKLRQKMEKASIEINDTTIKFTAIAQMMLNNVQVAVKEFLSYPELKDKMDGFCEKFLEITEENDPNQKKCVVELLEAVGSQLPLPPSVAERLSKLKST